MNIPELSDEFSKRKLTDQHFLFRGKVDLDEKVVETVMRFKDIVAFENIKSNYELFDEGSITVQEANVIIETHEKKSKKVRR